jgi:hypothetical protein
VVKIIYILLILISAIISLKTFKRGWPLSYKIFSVYVWLCFFSEITAWGLAEYQKRNYPGQQPNNAWLLTAAMLPMYILLSWVYYESVRNRLYKKIIFVCTSFFILFALVNMFWIQKLTAINSYTHLFADCIIFVYIFLYFEELREGKEIRKFSNIPMIWIAAGNFIYHLLNIPFLFLLNQLNDFYPGLAKSYMHMYVFFIFINYILYIKSFLCPHPQQK